MRLGVFRDFRQAMEESWPVAAAPDDPPQCHNSGIGRPISDPIYLGAINSKGRSGRNRPIRTGPKIPASEYPIPRWA